MQEVRMADRLLGAERGARPLEKGQPAPGQTAFQPEGES
jgi:hypothetical protein